LTVAQERRWAKLIEAKEAFARLAAKPLATQPPDPELLLEIDDIARTAYREALITMEADARRGIRAWGEPQDPTKPNAHEIQGLTDLWVETFDLYCAEDFRSVAQSLATYCERKGLVSGSDLYAQLGNALLVARLHAAMGRKAALEHKPSEEPKTFLGYEPIDPVTLKPRRASGSKRGGLRFSEAAANFIREAQRDPTARTTAQTQKQHEAAYRLFADFVNDASLHTIDRARASEFLTTISRLHPHWARSANSKQLSLAELLVRYGQGSKQLSNRTLNRMIGSLSSVFKHARRRGHFDGSNPFSEQTRPKARKGASEWLPFSNGELQTLFDSGIFRCDAEQRLRPKVHTVETAMRWVPLIGLFSGMRLGEICGLRTGDIHREGDIYFFNVAENGEDSRRLKTGAATRRVPIHSELIKCGLLHYSAALPTGQLFPGLVPGGPDRKLSWTMTQAFTRLRRKLGINRPRVSFHSLRKNMGTALDRARVPQADVALILGHDRGFTLSVYAPLGLELPALKGIIEQARFGVDLGRLYCASDATVSLAS